MPRVVYDYLISILRLAVVLVSVLGVLAPLGVARAHPVIDRARARFDEADFTGSLDLLVQAERRSDLSISDLAALFELRALTSLANGDPATMDRSLASLAAIAPGHRLGRDAPPEVVEAFERSRTRARGALSISVGAVRRGNDVRVRARVDNDQTSIVREVRLSVRIDGGAWQPATDGAVSIEAAPAERIEYVAVAIGPGGAVLAADGTEASPQHLSAPELGAGAIGVGDRDGDRDRDTGGGGVSAWLWVAIGAVAIGAGVTVAVVVLTGGESDTTRPMLPTIFL